MLPDPSRLRSRAEIVFAEFLARRPSLSPDDVTTLCGEHAELEPELRRMHAELVGMRSMLAAAPGADAGVQVPRIEGFECLSLLGRGGMAEVWEARDLALGRRVAVKVMTAALDASDVALQRFEREAQAASRVQHRSIVAVHASGSSGGRSYIVQELVPGGRTLRDEIEALRRAGQPPPGHARRTAERFAALAAGLAAAHAAGIVHRDLKPQNVLCGPGGELLVSDFGLAHVLGDERLSRTGEFLGTYPYASPEQFHGDPRAIDAKSDVFSLGATLYECLTLVRPFEAFGPKAIARAVLSEDPEPPHRRCRWVPEELSLICMKALEKRPQERYASMDALREDLRAFLEHKAVTARAPGAWRRGQKWCRRHPTAASAIALGAAAFGVVLALYLRAEGLRREASQARGDALRQAEEARRESRARQAVVDFLVGLFDRGDPELADDPRASEVVARGIDDVREAAQLEPDVRARLLVALASVHTKLGRFQEATEVAEEALELWRALGDEHQVEAVDARLLLANTLLDRQDGAAARAHFEPVVERWHARADLPARTAAEALLGLAASRPTEEGETETLLDEAEELARGLDEHPPRLLYRIQDRRVRNALGRGDALRAEELLRDVLVEREPLRGTGSTFWLEPLANRALALQKLERLDEAEAAYGEAYAAVVSGLGADHPRALTLRNNLATLYTDLGRLAEAESLLAEVIERRERLYGAEDEGLFVLRFNLGKCIVDQGRYEEGRTRLASLAADLRARYGPQDSRIVLAESAVAESFLREGRPDEAAERLRRLLEDLPADSPLRAVLERGLAQCAARAGD